MKKCILCITLFLISFLSFAVAADSIPFQNDYEAIDRAAKSCFLVEIIGENDTLLGTGSGFVAFDEHYFVTNHHVIEDAVELQIYSDQYRNTHTLTDVVAVNEELDIAILAFPEGDQYEALPLAPNYELFRGQTVTAIGSPEGYLNTVSSGNISSLVYYDDDSFDIQFTAPISHGSSGGALFNDVGEVIGLIFAFHKSGNAMNYAVPIEHVITLYNSASQIIPLARFNFPKHFIDSPSNIIVSMEDDKVKITWNTVENGEFYQIYRISSTGKEKLLGTRYITDERESVIHWDAKPLFGETVSYYIVAKNSIASSSKSEIITFTIPPKPTPAPTKVPTPSPTPSPTPDPTPIPTLPDGIADQYKPGANGNDIQKIKLRMLELGYYKPNSKLGTAYNDIMKERIMLFQEENKLPVTGVLDNSTLLMLFSEDAKPTKKFSPTPKPTLKPTPRKTAEPRITLQIPDDGYGEWYFSRNDLAFRLQVRNVSSTKTVTSYEIYLYPTDSRGNRLLNPNEVYVLTCDTNVRPGKTVYTDYIFMDDADDIRYVYAAIHKVKYDNGKTEETYVRSSNYSWWKID